MLGAVRNLYHAQDINGEGVLQPFKGATGFFAKKINENCCLANLAFRIGYLVAAILTSPFLFIGMLIKLLSIPGLIKHNEDQKKSVDSVQMGLDAEKSIFAELSSSTPIRSGWTIRTITFFNVENQHSQGTFKQIKEEIDTLTKEFKKVYIDVAGSINKINDEGQIIFRINVLEKV
ncbi:MAG: hypothetical protein H0W88_11965 [Parachlamydiaceae bacterium]|nr:hypothetical protein [Parachlamydiaceae bacterium]